MIQEAYVSFEIAKLLKEKGFDESTSMVYMSYDDLCKLNRYDSIRNSNYNDITKNYFECTAPTHQMAMKWLRDEKNILIYVYPVINLPVKDDNTFHWRWDGKKKIHCAPHIGKKYNYESYEDAVEAALKYTLENLI